jgi:hypothetical protein
MALQIRQTVEQVWTQSIGLPPDMMPAEIDRFLGQQTENLLAVIEQAMGTAQGPLVAQWKADHNGREPDFQTKVALINTARARITEQVLQDHLYDKIPPEIEEPTPSEQPEPVPAAAMDRWRNPLTRSEPSPELEEQTDRWFPAKSTLWRVMLSYLLQAMREDGLPTPNGPQDPEMTAVIDRLEAAMIADGQPLDGPGALVP